MYKQTFAVHNYIFEQFLEKELEEPSDLKLNKLIYLSHCFHLGLSGYNLVNESVAVGLFGPVFRSLFYVKKICNYENDKIIQNFNLDDFKYYGDFIYEKRKIELEDFFYENIEWTKRILNWTIETYYFYTDSEICRKCNEVGSPWDIAKKQGFSTISNILIYNYYKKIYENKIY